MTIGPVRDQLGRDIARSHGRDEGRRAGRDEGRREMLWHMAVGCEVLIWQRSDRMSVTLAERHAGWLRGHALQALADLGDQRAIDILGGE